MYNIHEKKVNKKTKIIQIIIYNTIYFEQHELQKTKKREIALILNKKYIHKENHIYNLYQYMQCI